jgi:DNA-binding response OmpR family regulator
MPKQPASERNPGDIVRVLSVSPPDDRVPLQLIFRHSNWTLYHAESLPTAMQILREHQIGAMLCDRDLQENAWKELLLLTLTLPTPPPVIVTARQADDELWSEALNLGAYDVLAKPFDRRELFRSISLAWLHWRYRKDPTGNLLRAMRAAS